MFTHDCVISLKCTVLSLSIILTGTAIGQELTIDTLNQVKTEEEKPVNFKVMPFLSYNRNLEFMFGLIPMAMYSINPEDKVSPKSLSGVAGIYTTNGSYFITFFNRIYFKEDTWRASLFAITGDHYSQFFTDEVDNPGFYDFGTNTTIISAGIQRKLYPGMFGGISYSYSRYHTVYEDQIRPPETTELNGLEFNFLLDTRDAVYYPTSGTRTRLRWLTSPKWLGNDPNSNRIRAEYNQYFLLGNQKDIVGVRFAGSFGIGEIPFEQQVTIGGKDIRGYSQGQFRGDGLIALQGEYRYNFGDQMGLVGFAGLATLYGSATEDFNWDLYPGIGAGYRYKAFKDVNFNIGLDAAVGKDDWGIYFRIGEAF